MKLLMTILIMMSCVLAGLSQKNTSIINTGLTTSVSVYNYTYRGNLHPYLTLSKGPAQWELGPLLLVASNVGSNLSKGPTLTGLRVAYTHYPEIKDSKFTFYLGAELLSQRIKDTWRANAYDPKLDNFTDFTYRNVELLFEGYVGYGIRLQVGERFYLSKGIGAGVYLSSLQGDELSPEAPEVDYFDYRGYDNFGFAWNIKMGVGFNF